MHDLKFETRFGATVEVSAADFRECQDAGEKYFEEAVGVLSQTATRVKSSQLHLQELKLRRRWWHDCFTQDGARRERRFANILQWGRGTVTCPFCDDIYAATTLLILAARLDGVERRRFLCQKRHLLLETPEFVMGEAGGVEIDWHEPEARPPWTPYVPVRTGW